jgi:uncharacterized membrane protein YcaP (DUF421 family)
MLALVVLVAAHWIFSFAARDSATLSWLIKGAPTRLVHGGKADESALRAAHMSADDLDEDLREKGIDDVSAVAEARLERSGKLSVIKKQAG